MIPSFKDFSASKRLLEGDKVKIGEVLDKDIIVHNYIIDKSKHYNKKGNDEYVRIQFYYADDETKTDYVLFSGSAVLMNQLNEVKEETINQGIEFCFKTKIIQATGYYSFS